MSRPTIREVAQAAGVSVASVSRALSGLNGVSPDMSRKVHAAAADLGYQANVIARSLRMSATGTLGMLVPSFSNVYFSSLIESVERELAKSEDALIVSESLDDLSVERKRLRVLESRRVDGLVVVPLDSAESASSLQEVVNRVPTVLIDRRADIRGADYVGTDSYSGMRQILAHLSSQGAANIIYAGVRAATNTAADRNAAFRQCVGLPRGADDIDGSVYLGDFSIEWGVEVAHRIMSLPTPPDAVVCAADIIAVPMMGEFRDAGLMVPDQVMVASFDDSILARATVPRLTSVAHPLGRVASTALSLLDARTENPEGPTVNVAIEPELVVRASTLRPDR